VRRTDRGILLAVLALPALWVFRDALFLGQVLYERDIHLVWHPQVESFVRAVAEGSWPLWDPRPAFGQPLLADPSAHVAYPIHWLNLVLRPATYWTVFAVAHLLFSGIGLFLLARRWGASRPGAATGALIWTLAGPVLSLVSLYHHFASACWIPWVFLAADVAAAGTGGRGVLGWAGAWTGQILAGSGDMTAMTGLGVLGWLLVGHVRWRELTGPANRALAGKAVAALALALALSAVMWMPALEVVARSARRDLPKEVRTYWSLHPLSLADLVWPGFTTLLPLRAEIRADAFESREPFLSSLFLGAGSLLLAAAGVRRGAPGRFLAGLGVAGLVVALGRHTPLYGVAVFLLPPLTVLRYPVKAMAIVAFACAVLAGLGLDAWRNAAGQAPGTRRLALAATVFALASAAVGAALWARPEMAAWLLDPQAPPDAVRPAAVNVLAAALAGALAAALAWLRYTRPAEGQGGVAALGLAGLAVVDLALVGRGAVPTAPPALFLHRPAVLASIAGEWPRLYAYDYSVPGKSDQYLHVSPGPPVVKMPPGWPPPAAAALGLQDGLAPLTEGRWALDGGYEIDHRGLFPRDLANLAMVLRHVEGTPAHAALLRLAAVTHVVALHREGLGDLSLVAEHPSLFEEPLRVFAVPGALPRAYAVAGVRLGGGPSAFATLIDPAFDPSQEVLLPPGSAEPAPPGPAGGVRIASRRADHVSLEAEMGRAGHVVLVDAYDPGWRATVDGRPAAVHQANLAFRAVAVPAGRHRIELRYRPRSATWGAALALAGLAVAAVSSWRRRSA
jgi:hypothetical protein